MGFCSQTRLEILHRPHVVAFCTPRSLNAHRLEVWAGNRNFVHVGGCFSEIPRTPQDATGRQFSIRKFCGTALAKKMPLNSRRICSGEAFL